jgi:hypothetical protein
MQLNILLLSLLSSFIMLVVLWIGSCALLLNTHFCSKVYNMIRLSYAILYLKTLKLFGKSKLIRLFSLKQKLNEETTLLNSISEKDLVLPTSTKPKSSPRNTSKSTSKTKATKKKDTTSTDL